MVRNSVKPASISLTDFGLFLLVKPLLSLTVTDILLPDCVCKLAVIAELASHS